MEILWANISGLNIIRNDRWDREIRIYDDHSNLFSYTVNSIVLYQYKKNDIKGLELHYSFYDPIKHSISLFNKRHTIIAGIQNIRYSKEELTKIQEELLTFGKNLAKHLNIKFFSYSRNGFCCDLCNNAIGLEKVDVSKYKIDEALCRISKEEYNFIDANIRGQANRQVTINVKEYMEQIKDNLYCSTCIEKIRDKYIEYLKKNKDCYLKKYLQEK